MVAVLRVGSMNVEISAGGMELATNGTCSGSGVSVSGGGYRSSGVLDGEADLAGWAVVEAEAEALALVEVEGVAISPTGVGTSSSAPSIS